jgi:hypothetical protein
MRHSISRMEKAYETDAYIDIDVLNNPDNYRANDSIVTYCTAYALFEDVLAGNWMLRVNFGNHGIIRPDSPKYAETSFSRAILMRIGTKP